MAGLASGVAVAARPLVGSAGSPLAAGDTATAMAGTAFTATMMMNERVSLRAGSHGVKCVFFLTATSLCCYALVSGAIGISDCVAVLLV